MPQESLYTVSDIAQELNSGKATIKFVTRRFKNLIPCTNLNGQTMYPVAAFQIIAEIIEKLEIGMIPSHIDKDTSSNIAKEGMSESADHENAKDIRVSPDALDLVKSLFIDFNEQQRRIAKAHEQRAVAEERKAVAIEKRAEAEEKKAQAMNNIASALQEMNNLRAALEPTAEQIAQTAVSVLTNDSQDLSVLPGDEDAPEKRLDSEQLSDDIGPLDDLAALIQQDDILDDLLISEDQDAIPVDELDTESHPLINDDDHILELDDLSRLIREEGSDDLISSDESNGIDDLDDLSALLDGRPVQKTSEKDQMDADIEEERDNDRIASSQMDNLSKLIDSVSEETTAKSTETTDDLWLLVDDSQKDVPEDPLLKDLDDLSKLIDAPEDNTQSQSVDMDDLSLLVNDSDQPTSDDTKTHERPAEKITIDISPEDGIEEYKAAIMKTIIRLQQDGNDAAQATDILNENNVKTISGKPKWSIKAIEQIYRFIESAS